MLAEAQFRKGSRHPVGVPDIRPTGGNH